MFRSNHEPNSYRFGDKRRFQSKIANVSNPVYFMLPLKGSLGIGYQRLGSKTRMMGYRVVKEVLLITPAIWIKYSNLMDGRTADTGRQQKTAITHSVAQ